ncbi:MAG: hypothetical protein M3R45_12470 [Pseudomonadota bacterium]|nr:hypothetical protein [Pseudomonadota bacterium]
MATGTRRNAFVWHSLRGEPRALRGQAAALWGSEWNVASCVALLRA